MTLNVLSDVGNAILKNIVPQSVRNGIFAASAISKPPPARGTQPLSSSEQPRAISRAQPDAGYMTSDHAQLKTRIHKELFGGTGKFDTIDLDIDDDDVQEVPAPAKKETRASIKAVSQPAKEKKTPETTLRRTKVSSEEARTLGLGETTPKDAVLIDIPSNTPDMSFEQKSRYFTKPASILQGGYKPVDTLQGQKQSRQSFQYNSTRKNLRHSPNQALASHKSPTAPFEPLSETKDSQQPRQSQHHPRSASVRQNSGVDTPTNKRRKLDSPTRTRPHLANARPATSEVSQIGAAAPQVVQLDPHADELASQYNFTKPDLLPTQLSSGTKHTPMRDLALRENSPDELMDNEETFMKNVKKQRQQDQCSSDDSQLFPQTALRKRTTAANSRTATQDRGRAQDHSQPRRVLADVTPKTPKFAARCYEGSPDALHSTVQTSKRSKRSAPIPPSPPDDPSPPGVRFQLKHFVCKGFVDVEAYEIEIFAHKKTFSLRYKNEELMKDALISGKSLSKILKVVFPDSLETNIAILHLSLNTLPGDRCFLEFSSTKVLSDFLHYLFDIDRTIRFEPRTSHWIEQAKRNALASTKAMLPTRIEEFASEMSPNIGNTHSPGSALSGRQVEKRQRIIDGLDAPHREPTVCQSRQDSKDNETKEQEAQTQGSWSQDPDVPRGGLRQTRSRSSRENENGIASSIIEHPVNLDPRRQGPGWRKPLVYPPEGSRRETVTWEDLGRLEDDEFLNDSLVGFFIKYLQHNSLEKVKKMHFFNTFFYEKLTQPVGGKAPRRQINYAGVANWTKTVNLFDRDYVVVPVNESAHWYVMIICNLRSLRKDDQPAVEEDAAPGIPFATNGADDETTLRISPNSDVAKECTNTDTLLSEPVDITLDSVNRRRPGSKKAFKPSLKKYDIGRPVIITLDSLNLNRSPTATILKEYLVQEAKEKHNFDIDIRDIAGMTAKQIPLQSNFSDCGLYLCMYLEQFIHDPQMFVASLLQRDANAINWPKKLRSESLRQRLYDMLQELHMAQQKKQKSSVPPIGRILIRDEDLWTEKQHSVKESLEFYEDFTRRRKQSRSADRTLLEISLTAKEGPTGHKGQVDQDQTDAARPLQATGTDAIIIEDDPQIQIPSESTHTLLHSAGVVDHAAQPSPRANTPQELATRLRQQRSPSRSMQLPPTEMPTQRRSPGKPGNTSSTAIDLSTPGEEQSIERRRSVSVSTDFLSGNASYDMHREEQDLTPATEQQRGSDEATRQKLMGLENDGASREEEGVFEGFDDDIVAVEGQGRRRHSSVVPESNYGDDATMTDVMQVDDMTVASEMLLD